MFGKCSTGSRSALIRRRLPQNGPRSFPFEAHLSSVRFTKALTSSRRLSMSCRIPSGPDVLSGQEWTKRDFVRRGAENRTLPVNHRD